ncbi:Sporulation thiol-disulfide oxidoreductase A [bacterium HR12]|nr:Sporulation thiol-disulfide oxidoreductase A [bacterium HR12]GIU98386.1 MAG: hypothetical protein KatS3mg014_0002 [Actinomycetota bacterium]
MTRRKVSRRRPDAGRRARSRRRVGSAGRIGPAVLGLVGAVVVAGVVALVAAGRSENQRPAPEGRVTVTGDALPAYAEGSDPAVGLPAPALQGRDFEGRPISIGDDGRPKVIVFLAHWCPHCQREVPLVQGWLDREGMPAGVDLYSVATAIDPTQPNYPPDDWLRREGWTVPVLVDDDEGSAAEAYGVTGFPFFVFIDARGNVASRAAGELTIQQLQGYLALISAEGGT